MNFKENRIIRNDKRGTTREKNSKSSTNLFKYSNFVYCLMGKKYLTTKRHLRLNISTPALQYTFFFEPHNSFVMDT
jgi:hypothetical protein